MAEFIWNIRNYEPNTIATTRLAIAARNELLAMAEYEQIDFDHERRGILHIYRTKRSYEHALRVNDLLRKGGLERKAVSDEEIHAIEPALHGRFYGGFFTQCDSTGDIHKFTRGLARACERHGAKFRTDQSVRAIENSANGLRIRAAAFSADGAKSSEDIVDADGVVICAGTASRKLARSVGDRLNVYPVKGYSITVNLSNDSTKATAPWVSLLDDDAKIVTSRLGLDRLRVAGTAELNDFNNDISAARIKPLISWTRRQFPEVRTDNVVPWAGLRPMLPSMMPAVRASRRPRIFYNTGHGHLGWTLAGITARMVVNLVSQQL